MHGAGLEELFDCYRSAGDLDALAQVFDRTAEQLLKVARHLSRDEAQAEDLVQATFLAAIEHAERFDASRPLVPWLTGILTNKAQFARSLAARAPDPERLAERATEDPAHDTEIREFMATLERALERVPDAYRQVLRIHLAEGKGAEEIAHELSRPPGTVRVQLHRGLKRLRRLLPAGFALGGAAVLSSPRGLAAIRAQVLGRAGMLAKAGAGASAASIAGGALVGKKVALAVGLILVTFGLWRAVSRSPLLSRAQSQPERRLQLDSVARSSSDSARAGLSEVGEKSSRSAPESSTLGEAQGAALDIEVLWSDQTPAAGVGLQVVPWGERQPYQHIARTRTNESGHAEIRGIHQGTAYIFLDRMFGATEAMTVEVQSASTRTVRILVPEFLEVRGRVLDPKGRPVSHATVFSFSSSNLAFETGEWIAESDTNGMFYIRSIDPTFSLFACAPSFGGSEIVKLSEQKSGTDRRVAVDLGLVSDGSELIGTVTDPDGAVLAGARVWVWCTPTSSEGEWIHRPAAVVETGSDGTYRASGLRSLGVQVVVDAQGFPLWHTMRRIEPGPTAQLDVRLERGVSVTGTVRESTGAPVAGARISQILEPRWERFVRISTESDEKGVFRLEGLSPGEISLVAESFKRRQHGLFRPTTLLTAKPGESLEWNPTFEEGLVIRGRVVQEDGSALDGWSVAAHPPEGVKTFPSSAKTDPSGRFEIRGCADVPHFVEVTAPGERQRRCMLDSVRPGPAEIVLVVKEETRPSAYVIGGLLDTDGAPMGDAAVRASHERTDAYGYAKTDADGRFRVGPIPPGPYRIDFLRGNRSCKTVGPLEIAVDEERDLGTVRLELPGRLELVLHRANGTAFKPGAGVYLLDEAGYVSTADTRDGAKFVCSSLLPGTYRLECTDESSATEMRPIEIRAGECTRMELTLSAGVLREIQFVIEDGGPRPRKIHLVVHHGQETVIERDCYLDPAATHPSTTQGTYTLLAGFAVGHFEFEAAGEEGLHARGELDVVDLSARDEVVTFKLERRP